MVGVHYSNVYSGLLRGHRQEGNGKAEHVDSSLIDDKVRGRVQAGLLKWRKRLRAFLRLRPMRSTSMSMP